MSDCTRLCLQGKGKTCNFRTIKNSYPCMVRVLSFRKLARVPTHSLGSYLIPEGKRPIMPTLPYRVVLMSKWEGTHESAVWTPCVSLVGSGNIWWQSCDFQQLMIDQNSRHEQFIEIVCNNPEFKIFKFNPYSLFGPSHVYSEACFAEGCWCGVQGLLEPAGDML